MNKKWDAELYKKTSTIQTQLALSILDNTNFQGKEHVLDVGCGDGRITAYIATQLVPKGKVLGIDASDSMIQLAKETFSQKDYSNLEFQVLSAQTLNLQKQFDVVVSFNALHWVKEQIQALQNIYRALVPKGRVIILIHPRVEHIWGPMERASQSEKWQQYFKDFHHSHCFYDIDGYELLVNQSGLIVDSIQVKNYMLKFGSKEDYINVLKSFSPYLDRVPAEKRQEFLMDVATDFEKFTSQDEMGNLLCPCRGIEVFAHRPYN
jgi:trans-aconitate methyltransferase